jgi:hypothetical protein
MTDASPPPPRRTLWEAAFAAWSSPRLFSLILLALAVVLGAYYRFHKLGQWDMNGDEAVAWEAAMKPALRRVTATFWRLENGGKLPLYHIALHEWVRFFGDSLFAMRAMSAALGTLAIVLLFFAVREAGRSLGGAAGAEAGEVGGAFAALICALNLTIIASDRTAREFPLLTAAELAQIIFFLRAQRRGGWMNYLGIAVFTAIMLPTNYTASFLLAAEALWLSGLLVTGWAGSARARELAIFATGFAVCAGLVMLAPLLPEILASSRQAVAAGAVDWIKLQPIAWPYTVFRDVVGNWRLFAVLEVLIAFGLFWQWRSAGRVAWAFLAVWMVGPVLTVYLVTYLIEPMEFPRYVLIAFVGMFALAGFGAGSVRGTAARVALVALIIHLAAPLARNWFKIPRDGAWRQAAALAMQNAGGGEIAVCPSYNLPVVRFYLPPASRAGAVGMDEKCSSAPVMILSGRGVIADQEYSAAQVCYPRLIARLQLVEVRAR